VFAAGPLYERVTQPQPLERALAHLDRYDIANWLLSLEQTEIYLKLTKDAEPGFQPQAAMPVTPAQLAGARRVLGQALAAERDGGPPASQAVASALASGKLEAWKIIGANGGKLRVTKYFSARAEARHRAEGAFTRGIYRLPPDTMRDASGHLPTKQQIHAGALEGKVQSIAYLTPAAEAELHMEGSGILDFPDGQVSVNYEGNNGYAWKDELTDVKREIEREHGGKLPSSAWPLYKKRHTFLRELLLAEFKHLKLQPGQFLGFDRPFHRKMPVQEFVSTAMDPALVPSGGLGLLIAGGGRARLIKVDDQGAAFIDRPDKIDLFWGSYTRKELDAGQRADGRPIGTFPDWGELYFLVTPR